MTLLSNVLPFHLSAHFGVDAPQIVMDLRQNIENENVIIVEDILDTGRTLHYLIDLMKVWPLRPPLLCCCWYLSPC